ncbi:3'-5' exonuclease [Rickettsiales bacterium]|nr:3'-5' exonuclease [Rickettsiales bacterium]
MVNYLYVNDLPDSLDFGSSVAVDTEAMGLNNRRDRLCLAQFSDGNGDAHLVKFDGSNYSAPNIKKMLADDSIEKIFHYARFDMAILQFYLQVKVRNVYCTKIASRIARTYSASHSLKELCSDLLSLKLNKQYGCSDWGGKELSKEQINYAAGDVLHLHAIRDELNILLKRERRNEIAINCFKFLNTRVDLDLMGWENCDIFNYES